MKPAPAALAALLCTLSGWACAGGGIEEAADSEFIVDFDAELHGRPGYPNVHGSARAVASLGNTAVTISIQGVESGGSHPWHVHYGNCNSGGSIVGSPSSYPPLTPDEDGSDRVTTTISVQLDDRTDYHVNVHLSAERSDVIIACGRLVD